MDDSIMFPGLNCNKSIKSNLQLEQTNYTFLASTSIFAVKKLVMVLGCEL